MLLSLKNIFTPQAIAATLTKMPDLATTVLDTAFPDRPTHPFAVVGVGELTRIVGTVPVVRRGGQPVAVGGEGYDVQLIAPKPVKPSIEVTAAELNDLRLILGNAAALETWRTSKVDSLRRLVRDTTEAMASVVLYTGKVNWPSRIDGGGHENYVIDYGPVLTHTPAAMLTGDSRASAAYNLLLAMRTAIRQAGIGGKVAFHAGSDVFSVLLDICQAWTSTADSGQGLRVEIGQEQGKLVIGGFAVTLMDEAYPHPITGQWTNKLEPKALVAYATDVPGKVWYCAIDSISAANAATPFYVVPEPLPGDSGFRLIAQSKPLPARNPKTICKAIVVA